MHRVLLNRATIRLALRPAGPVLIKAGESGVDPSLPDMRFVRTHRDGVEQVYFPGSSLKGAVRSHCERIARTFAGSGGSLRMLLPVTLCSRRSAVRGLRTATTPRS